MSYKNIASALAIAAVMGVSGTAFAEPNDPYVTGTAFTDPIQTESVGTNMSDGSTASKSAIDNSETADFVFTGNYDDRA